jgi:hypothetical protein
MRRADPFPACAAPAEVQFSKWGRPRVGGARHGGWPVGPPTVRIAQPEAAGAVFKGRSRLRQWEVFFASSRTLQCRERGRVLTHGASRRAALAPIIRRRPNPLTPPVAAPSPSVVAPCLCPCRCSIRSR